MRSPLRIRSRRKRLFSLASVSHGVSCFAAPCELRGAGRCAAACLSRNPCPLTILLAGPSRIARKIIDPRAAATETLRDSEFELEERERRDENDTRFDLCRACPDGRPPCGVA